MTIELAVTIVPLDGEGALVDQTAPAPSCLLDSSLGGGFSFLGLDPFSVLTVKGSNGQISHRDGAVEQVSCDPFEMLRTLLRSRRIRPEDIPVDAPPFLGGAIGYLGYELAGHLESLPSAALDDLSLPDMAFCFFDTVVVHDHETGTRSLIVTQPRETDPGPAIRRALALLDSAAQPAATGEGGGDFTADLTRDAYVKSVRAIKEHIAAGDIYQANLTQRFHAAVGDPWRFYRRLRALNPAPFSAYLDFTDFQVASSSPERFLRVEGRTVETRPIKGTRPRSADPVEDERLQAELRSSVKDRAELAMIVDVERNDLGRVCEYGSVEVAEHATLESFATVHHLVSTVRGRLRDGVDIVDVLRATFPSGSVTGAPKIRAMKIIDEFEPTARSVYTGSIGYLGFNESHELNVAIRTAIVHDGRTYVQVGGGIVADSEPAAEYQETLDKGEAMFQAVRGVAE